jgi:thiamine kinase-like enzyme/UTP-glucose-1-phosphate uridylyltransferase
MQYKVCIMAAGKGTRLSYAANFNKAILPVGEKSILSYIIHKFPKEIEVVIAVGYNSQLIKDFVRIAYPDRKITIVDVDNWEGPGSGPGYSLYACRQHLQCPFIFTSADTIVLEDVPEPSMNWLGIAKVNDSQDYCMAGIRNNLVKAFYIKMPMAELLKHCSDSNTILDTAFIGMAGVYDYQAFWQGFAKKHERVQGEVQVMDGLEELIYKKLSPLKFTWFDTGNDINYYFARKHFSKLNLLPKPDEFLYFESGSVIKYFSDPQVIADRVARAKLLQGIVPDLTFVGEHFYAYNYVEGVTLSKVNEIKVFIRFLKFCQGKLWQPIKLDEVARADFFERTRKFYFDKTQRRLEKFYQETEINDQAESINGILVPELSSLLKKIDWDDLARGIPVLFHGDTQPENIIVHDQGFTLIDWRHNFEGLISHGDVYYDLAKLYHALIVSHEIIRKDEYEVTQKDGKNIFFNFLLKNNLLEFKNAFDKFIIENGYSLQKVKLLTSLIFLNIAPLHHYPYNIFLYYLGKSMLYENINHNNK